VLRRHPIAFLLLALVIAGALAPLGPLVDVASGSPPGDVALVLPAGYLALAPLSNLLDALTFLSVERAPWALGAWLFGLTWWGVLSAGSRRRRLARAVAGPVSLVALAAAAAALARPVPRLAPDDSGLTVIDYHAHTAASHDGRRGWIPGGVRVSRIRRCGAGRDSCLPLPGISLHGPTESHSNSAELCRFRLPCRVFPHNTAQGRGPPTALAPGMVLVTLPWA